MTKRALTKTNAFRAIAGALTAFMVVIAYVTVGFILIAVEVVTGHAVTPQEGWMAGLSSLASAGLGYLIGRMVESEPTPREIAPPLPPIASGCTVAGCPMNRETPPYESS